MKNKCPSQTQTKHLAWLGFSMQNGAKCKRKAPRSVYTFVCVGWSIEWECGERINDIQHVNAWHNHTYTDTHRWNNDDVGYDDDWEEPRCVCVYIVPSKCIKSIAKRPSMDQVVFTRMNKIIIQLYWNKWMYFFSLVL